MAVILPCEEKRGGDVGWSRFGWGREVVWLVRASVLIMGRPIIVGEVVCREKGVGIVARPVEVRTPQIEPVRDRLERIAHDKIDARKQSRRFGLWRCLQ
jgi:hypothetical protein